MKLKVAMIFQDHMIFQRNKEIPIWGYGEENTDVIVQFENVIVKTTVKDGKWISYLPKFEASTGLTLKISSKSEKIIIKDISVGEVWIAGGQSNMEFYLRFDKDYNESKDIEENFQIRFFDYPKTPYENALKKQKSSDFGKWRMATSEDLEYFSAVSYYFARKVQKEINVPIGIIGCNWGGTPACAWMDKRYLSDNEGQIWLDKYSEETKDLDLEEYEKNLRKNPMHIKKGPFDDPISNKLLKGISRKEQLELMNNIDESADDIIPPLGPKNPNRPGGLYENMLKKIAPFAMRGVIWYQGESDDDYADVYYTVFKQMIKCWRDLWKEEFPFLFVQLAPFEKWLQVEASNYPTIRMMQEKVSKKVPKTWMASTSDVGMRYDIHPKTKKPVGDRLALLAIGHVYGENILCDTPECVSITVNDEEIVLSFDNAKGGLVKTSDTTSEFKIYRNKRILNGIDIEIQENKILLKNSSIKKEDKIKVEFAMTNYYNVNIYNKANISLKPFCIENKK